MAGPNQRTDRQLARLRLEAGNIFGFDDVVRMGELAVSNLLRLAMMGYYDGQNFTPVSGVFGEPGRGPDHLKVTKGTGDLEYGVAIGCGLAFDSTQADDDFNELDYQMVLLDTPILNNSVGAHDATNPRIDVISIAPATVEDVPESRVTRNVSPPGLTTTPTPTVNVRSRPGGTVTVTAGTPAVSPVAPATPNGHIKLAEVLVPAVSGAITVTDARSFLQLGNAFRGLPPSWMQEGDHVAGGATVDGDPNMEPTFNIPSGNYAVSPGWYTYLDEVRWYEGVTGATFGVSPGVNEERIDIISFDPANGAVERTGGVAVDVSTVPAAGPVRPAIPAGNFLLASCRLNNSGPISASFTDERDFGHVGAAQLRREAVAQKNVVTNQRTILIPGTAFNVVENPNNEVAVSNGTEISVISAAGTRVVNAFFGFRDLPPGASIAKVGVIARGPTGGNGRIGFTFSRSRLLGGATVDNADIAILALGNFPTTNLEDFSVDGGSFQANEEPQIVDPEYVYGITVDIESTNPGTSRLVGAYLVIDDATELRTQGVDGDIS